MSIVTDSKGNCTHRDNNPQVSNRPKDRITLKNDTRERNRLDWARYSEATLKAKPYHNEAYFQALLKELRFQPETEIHYRAINKESQQNKKGTLSKDKALRERQLEIECRQGFGVYYQPVQRLNKEGNLNGVVPLIVESDEGTLQSQLDNIIRLGLPLPSAITYSGNRSLHIVYLLDLEDCPIEVFEELQSNICAAVEGDENTVGYRRLWRFPGSFHPKTKEKCALYFWSGRKYELSDLLKFTPSLGAKIFSKVPHWLEEEEYNARYFYKKDENTYLKPKQRFDDMCETGLLKLVSRNSKTSHYATIDESTAIWASNTNQHHFGRDSGSSMSHADLIEYSGLAKARRTKAKTKNLLREELEGAEVQNSRWVSIDSAKFTEARLVAIQANQGTGKSFSTAKELKESGLNKHTIAVSALKAIVEKLAADLDIDHYEKQAITEDLVNGMAICLPSLDKIQNVNKSFVLYIEEVDIVLNSLFEGNETLKEMKQVLVANVFKKLVGLADKVIITSANIFPEHISFFRELMGIGKAETYIIQNTTTIKKKATWLNNYSLANTQDLILSDWANGEKGFVFCTGKQTSIDTSKLLEDAGAKVLNIHGDNSHTKEAQFFVAYPDKSIAQNNWDWIVVSPSVYIGTSIEVRDYFKKVYALVEFNKISPLSISQGLNRVRDENVQRIIYTKSCKGRYPETPRAIVDFAVNRMNLTPSEYGGDFSKSLYGILPNLRFMEGKVYREESDYVWLYTVGISFSRLNKLKNNFEASLREAVALEGYEITKQTIDDSLKETDTSAVTKGNRERMSADRVAKLQSATIYSDAQLEEIESKATLDEEEVVNREATFLSRKFPNVPITETLYRNEDKLHAGLKKTLAVVEEGYARDRDAVTFESADIKNFLGLKSVELVKEIGTVLEIENFRNLRGIVEPIEKELLLERANSLKKKIKAALGIDLNEKGSDNSKIKKILQAFNIYTKSKMVTKDGDNFRAMVFDEEKCSLAESILEGKQQHWADKEKQKEQETLNTVGLSIGEEVAYWVQNEQIEGYKLLGLYKGEGQMMMSTGCTWAGSSLCSAVWIQDVQTGQKIKVASKDVSKIRTEETLVERLAF